MAKNFLSQYFIDSWHELDKVTWPTRNRAINVCILVIVFVFISAAAIAGIDFVFNLGYRELLDLAAQSPSPESL
ncbi:preprotein translocase subunit SecE [Candidatus Peregrinibacteria bacterium CG11_big_fil_rev_8_21_14_0_20_46_8]|nr:MAG: preprotein translocase subunit SecE [Candidatus Peregrinibacteria bacterium CG11_big_fil_rev_8_21_14_0_20_46_8]